MEKSFGSDNIDANNSGFSDPFHAALKSLLLNIEDQKKKNSVDITALGQNSWIFSVEKQSPIQRWEFVFTLDSNGNLEVETRQPKLENGKWTQEYTSFGKKVVSFDMQDSSEFMKELTLLLDQYLGEKRDHFPSEGKNLQSQIADRYKQLEQNGDVHSVFVLGEGTEPSLSKSIRRVLLEQENITLPDHLINYLASDVMRDNNILDARNIEPYQNIILKKSTFMHYVPKFYSEKRVGGISLSEQVDSLIKAVQGHGIILTNKDRLKNSLLRINAFSDTIQLPQFIIDQHLSEFTKGRSLDVIQYQAMLKRYSSQGENTENGNEFGYTLMHKAREEFGMKIFNIESSTDPEASEKFELFMASIIDFNAGVRPFRSIDKSNDIWIPRAKSFFDQYFQEYASQKKSLENEEIQNEKTTKKAPSKPVLPRNEDKDTKPAAANSYDQKELPSSDVGVLSYLLKNGRLGFLEHGKRAKRHQENHAYMKHTTLDYRVSKSNGQPRYEYVKNLFADSSLSGYMKLLGPEIPKQETGYRSNVGSTVGAYGLWQFMPATRNSVMKSMGKKGSREDIELSTLAAIHTLKKDYDVIQKDPNLSEIMSKIGVSTMREKDLLFSLFTINAHNSGLGHMQRAFKVMNKNLSGLTDYRKKLIDKDMDQYIKKHGSMGLFLFVTEHYAKGYKQYQQGISPKYISESPDYVYNIMKYSELENKSNSNRDFA